VKRVSDGIKQQARPKKFLLIIHWLLHKMRKFIVESNVTLLAISSLETLRSVLNEKRLVVATDILQLAMTFRRWNKENYNKQSITLISYLVLHINPDKPPIILQIFIELILLK